ncbi:hypothetical protein THASP1DRAFT_24876, partial [Thamnocephalis sphaerospora]
MSENWPGSAGAVHTTLTICLGVPKLERQRAKFAACSGKKMQLITRQIERYGRQLSTNPPDLMPPYVAERLPHAYALRREEIEPEKKAAATTVPAANTVAAPISTISVQARNSSYAFPVASQNHIDVLSGARSTYWKNAFLRKPRSILLHPECGATGGALDNLLVGSALDGCIRFWDCDNPSCTTTRSACRPSAIVVAHDFAAKGNDKRVALWQLQKPSKLGGNAHLRAVRCVHTLHSSAVYALLCQSGSNTLYSGGADSRIISWDLQQQRCIHQRKFADRNPVDSNLMLVT